MTRRVPHQKPTMNIYNREQVQKFLRTRGISRPVIYYPAIGFDIHSCIEYFDAKKVIGVNLCDSGLSQVYNVLHKNDEGLASEYMEIGDQYPLIIFFNYLIYHILINTLPGLRLFSYLFPCLQ